MSAHKYEVIVFAKLGDEPTEVERPVVYATDPDDACGVAIGICQEIHGADVDCSVQRIVKLGAGNSDVLEMAA